MNLLPFTLVMVSAVSHALWNYMAKEVEEKESFMALINVSSLVLMIHVFFLILPDLTFPFQVLPYLLVLYAMSLAQVSYILALRQVSVVLGAVIGIVLKERYGKVRIISSLVIFLGVYIHGALA
ncbi:MAG: hypothetical protein NWE89_16200 [Candidatus Bathyarchaeota archaeon]|nr:hypothetical protein [Candidatus Bathyarchaeota archaeon]